MQEFSFPLNRAESAQLYSALSGIGASVWGMSSKKSSWKFPLEKILCLAADQSRFDYRLLYVLTAFVIQHYQQIHPFTLRDETVEMDNPSVWGVVLDFAQKWCSESDFLSFKEIVIRNLRPAPPQLYSVPISLGRIDPLTDLAERSPEEFKRWGFFSDEPPILKELTPISKTMTMSPETRRAVLLKLLSQKKEISVSDYLLALNFMITRQQAHRDLIGMKGIRKISDRRGRRYQLAPAR